MKTVIFQGIEIKIPYNHFYVAQDRNGAIWSYSHEPVLQDYVFFAKEGTTTLIKASESWYTSLATYRE